MAETLRFDVIGRGDASDIRRLAEAIERLIRDLRRLDAANARPDVDIDTRRAERNLGRFATEMHRRISRAIDALPDIELDADSTEAQRELASIRARLAELDDLQIGVDISSVEADRRMAQLQARLDRLDSEDVDVQVRADATAASTELARVEEQLDNLDGRTVRVRVHTHTSFREAINEIAVFARNLRTLTIPVALTAAAPLITAVGAAALEASQSLFLIPAAALAAAGAIGTLVVGFQGFGEAMKNRDDPAKFAEAIAQLSPAARDAAVTIRDLGGAWDAVRLDVQERLFRGVGQQIQALSGRYLPPLHSAMGGIADGFNRAATSTAQWLSQDPQVQRLSATFDRVRQTVVNAAGSIQPLVEAFVTLAEVGSTRLPRLGQALADATARFRDWVNASAATGELGRMIDQGIASLRQLGQITVNVGATLINVLRAADQAGAGMLDTLERVTGAMREWTASAQGTQTLISIFTAIRTAINAVGDALGAFVSTGALVAVGNAIVQIGRAVDQLLPVLGRVAGEAIANLANAVSIAAAAMTPLIDGLAAVLNAVGPLAPAILAAVIAFRAMATVGRLVTGIGSAAAAAALSLGVYTERLTGSAAAGQRVASVGGRISQAFSRLGQTLPFVGVALVGVALAMEEFGSKADQVAQNVLSGTISFASAVRTELAQLNKNYLDVFGREQSLQGEFLAQAHRNVTEAINEQLAAMGPMEQLQARAAMAQANLSDAVVQYGANSQQAAAASAELAAANQQLAAAEAGANAAAAAHNQTLAARVGAVQSALGAMLQMEGALARVAEAETAANDAARAHGEGSTEAAAANRAFAQAADQAAQAVGEQARAAAEARGAVDAAEVGARAYAATLVQTAAAAEGPARSALFNYIDTLSDVELAALNAGVQTSGFATRVETLPSGRTVLIAVDPETGEIIEVQALVDGLQDKTITINGNAMPAQQALTTVLSLIAGGAETVTINGQAMPAQQALQTVLGMITSASGTVMINGQPQPAQDVLNTLIGAINAGKGAVVIGGQVFTAQAVLSALLAAINSSTATVTLDANGQPVTSAKTDAEQPTQSPHTLGSPTTDNTTGPKAGAAAPTQNPHTVGSPTTDNTAGPRGVAQGPTQNPHTVGSPTTDNTAGPKAGAAAPTQNPHTVGSPVDTGPVDGAKTAAQQPTQSMHTINCTDSAVLDAKRRAEQPTQSMHTINCNDSAVRSAKSAAQRSTSSTHTIFVRVVGGGVPRAAGAFAVPRAQGAYAAPMANGGMRTMSAGSAEIVPARQPRIIGDRMRGPEAFIPVNRSARSRAILGMTANAMGFHLTPRRMADGGVLNAVRAASTGVRVQAAGGGEGLLAELREVSALLRALRGDVDHHTDHAATASRLDLTNRLLSRAISTQGSAGQTAESWRTTAELGAF